VATVAVGCVLGGIVCTENHGAQGGKTSSNYGNRRLDHRDGARQHCLVLLGVIGSNDASDDDEETQGEDCGHTDLLLEFHLQSRNHGYRQANNDHICNDVEEDGDPVVDLGGFGTALICAWSESTVCMYDRVCSQLGSVDHRLLCGKHWNMISKKITRYVTANPASARLYTRTSREPGAARFL